MSPLSEIGVVLRVVRVRSFRYCESRLSDHQRRERCAAAGGKLLLVLWYKVLTRKYRQSFVSVRLMLLRHARYRLTVRNTWTISERMAEMYLRTYVPPWNHWSTPKSTTAAVNPYSSYSTMQ